jgi:Domain of unknown function (DUF5658)
MLDVRSVARTIAIGPDDAWTARIACGPLGITLLAALGLVLQALDLITGVRMMQTYGIEQEQNPIARTIFQISGPVGLTTAKFSVVFTGVVFLLLVARAGRPRLARNALLVIAMLGLLGFSSNLI